MIKTTFVVRIGLGVMALCFSLAAQAKKDCQLQYKNKKTKVEWTAFKTTQKVAVKGQFKKFSVAGKKRGASMQEILRGLSFTINSKSTDTDNKARDATIVMNFFAKMMGGLVIHGFVENLPEADSGTMQVRLGMNGTSQAVPMTYKIDRAKHTFVANGEINVLDWGMQASMKGIQKACYELHKGPDGVSKTWSTMDIRLSTEFKQRCK